VASIAHPQSRDFKRWAVGETEKDIFKTAVLWQTTSVFRVSWELLINCQTAVRWQKTSLFRENQELLINCKTAILWQNNLGF